MDVIEEALHDLGLENTPEVTVTDPSRSVSPNVVVEPFDGDLDALDSEILDTPGIEHFDSAEEVSEDTPTGIVTSTEDTEDTPEDDILENIYNPEDEFPTDTMSVVSVSGNESEENEKSQPTVDLNDEELNAVVSETKEILQEVPEEKHDPNHYINPISDMYSVDESTTRFSGAAWFKAVQDVVVTVGGAGGIGSMLMFCLSRVKPKQIYIYDGDIVEAANMSGQMYSKDMIGLYKTDAMAQLASSFSDYNSVIALSRMFTKDTSGTDIMICGFDNMSARKMFFKAWKKHLDDVDDPSKCLFIDGRLAAEDMQIFCITGNDVYNQIRYEKEFLFKDSEAEHTVCSFKQTSHCANMIGSLMCNLFVNFIANTLDPIVPRGLPFKIYYDAQLMFFKAEI